MLRIGVLAGCHLNGIVACLQAYLPDAQITPLLLELDTDTEAVHACAREADLFYTHLVLDERFGGLRTPELPSPHKRLFPLIIFDGFHPDTFAPATPIDSPLGGYHSALIAAAFLSKRPPNDALTLFQDGIYAGLGYYASYDRSMTRMRDSVAYTRLDLDEEFQTWTPGVSFMHTINHPRIEVFHDLVRRSLLLEGLIDTDRHAPMPADELSPVRLPVFDFVAARFGVATEPLYTLAERRFPLSEFAEGSYAIYDTIDPALLTAEPAVERALAGLRRLGVI